MVNIPIAVLCNQLSNLPTFHLLGVGNGGKLVVSPYRLCFARIDQMQHINLTDQGPTLSHEDIEFIESQIEGLLPEGYRNFMLKNNGGMADPYIGFHWKGDLEEVVGFFHLVPSEDCSPLIVIGNF